MFEKAGSLPLYKPRSYPPGVVRLDLNESPYPPPEHVVAAALEGLAEANRYPDADLYNGLLEAVSAYTGFPAEGIVLSGGSDSLIRVLFEAAGPGSTVAVPRHSFSMYRVYAARFNCRIVEIPVRPEGDVWLVDREALLGAASEADLIVLDRPNNPTGSMLIDRRTVEELASSMDRGIILVDEAYYEYSGETLAGLVETGNLVIARTLSKAFGLAGLRVGYALTHPRLAEALRRLIDPFQVSRVSAAAAAAALRDPGYMWKRVREIVRLREELYDTLRINGFKAFRSRANFILVDTGIPRAASRLLEHGVAVRSVDLGDTWIRVTIGTPTETEKFMDALTAITT